MAKSTFLNVIPIVVLVLLLVSVCPSTFSYSYSERRIDPDLQNQIDDFITNFWLPQAKVTGLVLTIVKDDGDLLYTTGYGLSDVERGYENGNRTQFGVGSISKSFTSLLIVKILHEAFPDLGEIVMDTPIKKLVPTANITLIDRLRSEHSTFRDLLAHLVGVEEQLPLAEPFSSLEDYIYRARYNQELFEPRTNLFYNNQLYAMAGELAALIAGKPYEAAMEDLWSDLGMNETTWMKRSDNFSNMPYRAMPYYRHEEDEFRFLNPDLVKRLLYLNAAAGVFSTPDDMARYMRFHMNRGNIDGKQIIPEDVMRWLVKPSFGLPSTYKESEDDFMYSVNSYGLGLISSSYDGWELIEHPGNLANYVGYMSMWPGKKLAVYAGTHQFPLRYGLNIVPLFVYELLNGNLNAKEKAIKVMQKLQAEEDEKTREAEQVLQNNFAKMLEQSRNLGPISVKVGKYGSGSAGELELSERFNEAKNQSQYFIQYGEWYHGWLEPVEGETSMYKITWVTDVVQDDLAQGLGDGLNFAVLPGDDTITILVTYKVVGVFRLGVGLDTLPAIPWDPTSC